MRVLVLAPHTDDGELGCGGTIARFVEEEKDVFCIAFSAAEKSIVSGFPRDILRREAAVAVDLLGVRTDRLQVLDFEVRSFSKYRQEILDFMIGVRDEIKPDMVLLPSTNDTHQDHQVVYEEGFRAFKSSTILGYELPWNNLHFTTDAFVTLSESQLGCKLQALQAYRSQAHRDYMTSGVLQSLAAVRGSQVCAKYAEAFEVVRWVIS